MTGTALVAARGGSRRVPRKNVRDFLGEPSIVRVLRTIRESGVADRVMVSTDDREIAEIGRGAGAEVPELRPATLADDHTPTIDVVRHAIGTWLTESPDSEALWVVYPTALLLRADDLRAADTRFRASTASFLVPVLRYPHPVERRLLLGPDGGLMPVQPELLGARTQDLKPCFHDAGQFYVGSIAAWRSSSPLLSPASIGLELPRDRILDIDTPEDWSAAEAYARAAADPSP